VKLPCPLEPGEYSYEIWLFEGLPNVPEAGMSMPQFKIPAKIVVEGGS
jgi:hypothetical protein